LEKDGTIIHVDIGAAKAVIDGRECNIGFFIDVTERMQAEEQIKTVMAERKLSLKNYRLPSPKLKH